jgi:hypothetical protein
MPGRISAVLATVRFVLRGPVGAVVVVVTVAMAADPTLAPVAIEDADWNP